MAAMGIRFLWGNDCNTSTVMCVFTFTPAVTLTLAPPPTYTPHALLHLSSPTRVGERTSID